MENDKKEKRSNKFSIVIGLVVAIIVFIIILIFNSSSSGENDFNMVSVENNSKNSSVQTFPSPLITNSTKNDQLDISALTPQTINKIVQKIRSTPNASCGGYPCIKTTFDSGVGVITLFYEFSADSLTPGSKESLLVEISTKTYLDEERKPYLDRNGNEIPKNDIVPDVFMFRDTDFDAMPNDYWSNDFGSDLNFEIMTTNTPDIINLLTIWAFAINYFNQNLLN